MRDLVLNSTRDFGRQGRHTRTDLIIDGHPLLPSHAIETNSSITTLANAGAALTVLFILFLVIICIILIIGTSVRSVVVVGWIALSVDENKQKLA